ncbi:CST complex subunit CTC1 isoform X1 [Senna tora]|uniref:CST complex subunit CTC1 n=1 Tax=Senna tora TaxID=362788 RepID=A0A834W7P5_9FABA|nr:CST complex subunit CTC1 isoform X1 [Senna tora]
MDDVKIFKIAELLQAVRPLSATASLYLPSTHSVPNTHTTPSSTSNPSPNNYIPTLNPNPNPRVLTASKLPTIVVGTLTLPSHNAWSHSRCACFQFTDGTSTLCCDILEFDPCVIGKEIRVYAWNFIPFKRGKGGFLEIIKWGLLDSSDGLRKGLNGVLNNVGSFPLVPGSSSAHGGSYSSWHRVYGVVESVGPLSVVPCTMIPSGSKSTEDGNSASSRNLPGFLVQVVCCECRLCGSKELTDLSGLMADGNSHSFTKLVVVYFVDHASSWHSVITKLIGTHIMVSGLKRKLVFIGKEESRIMYVATDKSVLHVSKKWLPCSKIDTKESRKFGTYTGIIKGIYMQGMVVELDHDVWLLLTDQILTLPHSLRVGAIISIRNVHFVDPKFSWTKILILGACVKTSIVVESFSPLETVCQTVSRSPSMLGNFIESLPFSARLWCYQKEGLAQMWASSQLPSSEFQAQHDVFMGFCRHDSYGCGRELHCGTLKLALPMSSFISQCRATLMSMLKSGNNSKLLTMDNYLGLLSCEARSHGRSVRRIISSEDVGCLLLGYLKIAPSFGRLQFVDATGSIDVIIPDLPLTWDPNELYEVMDYNIIVDGLAQLVDHLELHKSETLSCRNIFNCSYTQATKGILEPGTYHLLRVPHKPPLLQKMSSKSISYFEAMLLPWILLLTGKKDNLHPPEVSRDQIKDLSENCISGNTNSWEQVSNKRQKLVKESRRSLLKDEFGNSVCELSACSNSFSKLEENKSCINLSSSHQIPCLVTFRNIQIKNVHSAAILLSALSVVDKHVDCQPATRKVLLEFLSENFLKYQLQIGGHYIIKHHKKDCFCTLKDAEYDSSVKVLDDSRKNLWSLSLVSDEVLLYLKSDSSTQDILSPKLNGVLPRDQIEHLSLGSNVDVSGISSEVCLYLPANLKDLVEDDNDIMKSEGQAQQKISRSAYDDPCSDKSSNLSPTTLAHDVSVDSFSSGLISELNQCPSHRQMWLRCRVVAVFVLFLESNATVSDLQEKSSVSGHLFDIPIAGFVLDDGSSSCCCWANAERAVTLLRLHEELPKIAFESNNMLTLLRLHEELPKRACSTASYHLGRILKTYKRITMQSYGSFYPWHYQKHVVSATSGNAVHSSDESLLKLIAFNSCFGGHLNVAASLMNADEVRQLQKQYHIKMGIRHAMPHVWAKEVSCVSTLIEARNMAQQLLKGYREVKINMEIQQHCCAMDGCRAVQRWCELGRYVKGLHQKQKRGAQNKFS